jgi:molecular chaperone HtpG
MSAEEIKKYINQIAFSGASEFVEKFKDAADAKEIIGKFGLGFYSSFMVAKKVEIITKSYQEDAEAAKWVCDGDTDFEIKKENKKERGTEIILHIADDSEEFLEESRIQGILDKYCKFLPVEIRFGQKEKSVEDGKDKDGNPKYKTEKVDNIINNTAPIWTKSPNDLKDEDYLAFYKELHPFSEDPLFWIHLNVDYPFNLTGVLYFPKVSNNIELDRNKILLFSRQVFITDEVRDIVPEYLRLLHGVIDSPDIPLNVSRSYLQSDSNVKKINNYITKKVADKLAEIFKNDRKAFEEKFDNIDVFVKYGMISDEKFYEKAKDFALVKSLDGKYHTFEEYSKKIEGTQKDKNDNLVWLYSSDKDRQHTFIESAQRKGYDVIEMGGPIDNHFINHIEMKLEKTTIKRVDSDIVDKLIEKDEKMEHVLTDDEQKQVKEIFEKVVPNEQYSVSVESLPEDELPVHITMSEYMRRMKDMQAMGGGGMAFMGNMPDSYSVQINGNHKLVRKILNAKTDKTRKSYAKQAMDLARLSQGLLIGKDLGDFINRSVEIASK